MMTTYFPSLLLTTITFATTFFKPFFFEAALSVNLTTMLVMTTIFISKMEGLPPTSDIKMIDIWLVLCQMVPFAEVVLLTAMEYYRMDVGHVPDEDIPMEMNIESQEKDAQKILILFDFPHILQSAMGEDRGYDDQEMQTMRNKNIESFQLTLENLMESVDHNKYQNDIIFHHFVNTPETNLAAELRERIYEEEDIDSDSSDSESDVE